MRALQPMKPLLDVTTFGAVDADNDPLLLDCFEDHEAFLRVQKRTHFLVVGRKGSGKTAIFKKMLTQASRLLLLRPHLFGLPLASPRSASSRWQPDFDKFTHSWKYLILPTVSKIILNFDQSLPFDNTSMDTMIRIEQFIVDTYGTKDPDVTQVFTPSKVLRPKPHMALDWKILKAEIARAGPSGRLTVSFRN